MKLKYIASPETHKRATTTSCILSQEIELSPQILWLFLQDIDVAVLQIIANNQIIHKNRWLISVNFDER